MARSSHPPTIPFLKHRDYYITYAIRFDTILLYDITLPYYITRFITIYDILGRFRVRVGLRVPSGFGLRGRIRGRTALHFFGSFRTFCGSANKELAGGGEVPVLTWTILLCLDPGIPSLNREGALGI